MKKVNPYLGNGASIFILIVAALQSVAEGDKTESGQIERFISLPLRQRKEVPGEHLWSQCGHASDPRAFSGSGPREWRPGGGGSARQSGLCAWKLGLLAPRFRHLPDGRQEWTGHLADGARLFLREDKQTNKPPQIKA